MTTRPILQAKGLVKQFFGFTAVDGVNLDIAEGSIHALIGPNGAGKTTVFNLLTKFLPPTAGTIEFKGQDVTNLSPAETARLGLVRSFQISAVFPHLSALENVRIALLRKAGGGDRFWQNETILAKFDDEADALLESVGIKDFRHTLAAELSYGRKRALEIATTLALDPDMMLLDEPTAGMDRAGSEKITALIKQVSANRTTLMVEHNMSVVSRICDRITVLARGRIIAEGTYEQVSKDARVVEAYLGGAHG